MGANLVLKRRYYSLVSIAREHDCVGDRDYNQVWPWISYSFHPLLCSFETRAAFPSPLIMRFGSRGASDFFLRLVYVTEMHWPRKPGKTSYKDQVTYRLQFRFKYPSTSFTFQEARNSLWHFIRFISNLSYKLIRCLLALLDCLPICMLFCFYSNRQ